MRYKVFVFICAILVSVNVNRLLQTTKHMQLWCIYSYKITYWTDAISFSLAIKWKLFQICLHFIDTFGSFFPAFARTQGDTQVLLNEQTNLCSQQESKWMCRIWLQLWFRLSVLVQCTEVWISCFDALSPTNHKSRQAHSSTCNRIHEDAS